MEPETADAAFETLLKYRAFESSCCSRVHYIQFLLDACATIQIPGINSIFLAVFFFFLNDEAPSPKFVEFSSRFATSFVVQVFVVGHAGSDNRDID